MINKSIVQKLVYLSAKLRKFTNRCPRSTKIVWTNDNNTATRNLCVSQIMQVFLSLNFWWNIAREQFNRKNKKTSFKENYLCKKNLILSHIMKDMIRIFGPLAMDGPDTTQEALECLKINKSKSVDFMRARYRIMIPQLVSKPVWIFHRLHLSRVGSVYPG